MASRSYSRTVILAGVLFGVPPAGAAGPPAPAADVAVVARAVQQGEVVRLDVTCECGDEGPRVVAGGAEVPMAPVRSGSGATVWQGLIGLDLETRPGAFPVSVYEPGRAAPLRTLDLRVLAKQFPTRRLQVAPTFVDPPPAELERITREAAVLASLFTSVTPRHWEGPFAAPVRQRATSNFGARSVYNGEARSPHGGVDFGSPTGTPVAAPAAGRIVLAEDLFFTGNTVVVDHGLGLFSVLAHLSAISVTQGTAVERGTIVGRVGATGRVTGPHLHWGIRLNGARVDPLSLLVATAEP